MFLSIKEICFFCLIFLIIGVTLIGFNQTFSNSKGLSLIISSYIVSLTLVIILLLIYKLAKIANCQTDGFHFEVSRSAKCRGYPYMQSSNPELLKECEKYLSSPEGCKMASCDGMYVGKPVSFEYTPESNDNWENKRCHCQKPTPVGPDPNQKPNPVVPDPNQKPNPVGPDPNQKPIPVVPSESNSTAGPVWRYNENGMIIGPSAGWKYGDRDRGSSGTSLYESYSYENPYLNMNEKYNPQYGYRLVPKTNLLDKGYYATLLPGTYGWIKPKSAICSHVYEKWSQ
uniref:Uncharacterized protein n=1 Tax=viral metagenome TaxID=1070528 RepID=A0A6C0H4E2_9ZZZZ